MYVHQDRSRGSILDHWVPDNMSLGTHVDHMHSASSSSLILLTPANVSHKEAIFQELWSASQNHQREVVGLGSEKLGV